MMAWLLRCGVAALALACQMTAARTAEFADMVRNLNTMQNRMVLGDKQAQAAVARQFDLVEQALAVVDPEIWTDEKNVRAAAIYLLAGGAPAQLRDYFEAGFVPTELAPLFDASLNYAEGQNAVATKLLMAFDARRFSPMLGGHLALVQGSSMTSLDRARAVSLFDLARLLMPASLVEEAALRREIALIEPARDGDKLILLASRYATNYAASPYASHFWRDLRAIVLAPSLRGDDAFLKKFDAALERAESADQVDIYLTLARRNILDGRLHLAAEKLDKASRAADAPKLRKRVAFYHRAVDALSAGSGIATLPRDEDAKDLSNEDLILMNIMRAVLTRLDARPSEERPNIDASSDAEPAILTRARDALKQSEALLHPPVKP